MTGLREPFPLLIAVLYLVLCTSIGARPWSSLTLGVVLGILGRALFGDRMYRDYEGIFKGVFAVPFALFLLVLVFLVTLIWAPRPRWPEALGPRVRGVRGVAFHALVLFAGAETGREFLRFWMGD